ncbi:hypothetical protein [Mycolicibacterium frederiksbergense]|nr:hypothetical protein [Mycolicibacterium frederiksbergense]
MRSTLTASVALAAVGAIAVSPISPVGSPLSGASIATAHTSTAAVELTALTDMLQDPALVDPVSAWMEVVGTAFNNVVQLGSSISDNPLPIVQQIIANQAGYASILAGSLQATADSYIQFFTSDEDYKLKFLLGQAFEHLSAGNISGAAAVVNSIVFRLTAFSFPLINIMQIPLAIGQNVMNVLSTVPQLLMPVGLGVLNPVEGAILSLGDSAQAVFDAVKEGNPAAAITSIINTPAVVTGAILNGYTNEYLGTSGLFTQGKWEISRGLIQSLLVTVPQTIAKAIGWQGPSTMQVKTGLPETAPEVVSSPDAVVTPVKTVTLSVAPQRNVAKAKLASAPSALNASNGADASPADASPADASPADASPADASPAEKATGNDGSSPDLKPQNKVKKAVTAAKQKAQAAKTLSSVGKHRADKQRADKPGAGADHSE